MKILFIINHLNVGGITSYSLTLAKGLKAAGHGVYCATYAGELLPKFKEAGVVYMHIPIKTKKEINPKILYSVFKLSKIIKAEKIDIVHTHSRTTQVLGSLLQWFTGVKHVFTCHGFFKSRILRRLFPCWGDKIIAVSQQVKDHLVQDFKVSDKKIVVINNGIDADRFIGELSKTKDEIRQELGLNHGPLVGIIARLSDVKGHKYLIEAMKVVLEKAPSAQLVIIGEGKMQEELKNLTMGIGISKSVIFIQQTSNMQEALSVMDVFVMPSLQEGLGLALMEAMASGLSVVGSNVGGIKTLIEHGRNGLLVEPADSQGLACAISKLLDDVSLRERLGIEARKFIQNNFSQKKMVDQTLEVYASCLRE
ncbi:MAG: glycosyltransferase family 4 protein [Candidatus Omnitrophica bacterium]|nr:glycosyltransferase family 4 protein [Candidatus Omnitrophota bacterium]